MRGLYLLLVPALVGACGAQISGGGNSPDARPSSGIDADENGIDGAPADAAGLGPWSTPTPITNAATAGVEEDDGTMSWSTNELVFAMLDGANKHLYVIKRDNPQSAFGLPTKLPFSTDANHRDESPRFSPDDLSLYFASTRTPTAGGSDVWYVTRPSVTAAWSLPSRLDTLSGATTDKWVAPCSAAYLMIRDVAGNSEVYGAPGGMMTSPSLVAELSSASGETGAYLSPSCMTAYFASSRDGTNDIWTSTRTAVDQPWAAPTKVMEFGSAMFAEQDPWMSADGRTFLFASNMNGSNDIYISTR